MTTNIPFDRVHKDILQIYESDPKIFTLDQQKPNWLLEADEVGLYVRTLRSGDHAEVIPWEAFEQVWNCLQEKGELAANDFPKIGRFRSSGISAVLARLPYVRYRTRPIVLFLTNSYKESAKQVPDPLPAVTRDQASLKPFVPPENFRTPWINSAVNASLAVWDFDPKFPICLLRPALEQMIRQLVEQLSIPDNPLDLYESIKCLRVKMNSNKERIYIDDMHFIRKTANAALHWPGMRAITYEDSRCALECFVKLAEWWEQKINT